MVPRAAKGSIMANISKDVVREMTLGSHTTIKTDLILVERTMGWTAILTI